MQTPNFASSSAIAHIDLLSNHLDQLYRDMKVERQAIARWEEEQDISILGVLELFATDIQGYVEQLAANHIISSPAAALHHLRELNVFDLDYFAAWYFANLGTYPLVKQYIEHLDHLRLLLLEHLSTKLPIAV